MAGKRAQAVSGDIKKRFSKREKGVVHRCCPTPNKPKKLGPALDCETVRKLVKENNASGYPDELIICQIFKETSFIPNNYAVDDHCHEHLGFMQMGEAAIDDVNKYVKKQGLKGYPTFTVLGMNIAVTAIQAGTLYLKYLSTLKKTTSSTLNRFGTGAGYSNSILDCEKCLKAGKMKCEDCLKLTHPKLKKSKKTTKKPKPKGKSGMGSKMA